MSKRRTYTIGEMVEQFGLTLRTLRWYEECGLLSPTRVGQARVYSEDDRVRLAGLVRWRLQGFTVGEMKDAIRKGGFTKKQIAAQIQLLRRQRDELDKSIADLIEVSQLPAPPAVPTAARLIRK